MRSLVTGATGLIGSHLVEALAIRAEEVVALVRPTSRTRRLRELGVDVRVGNLMDGATLISAAEGVECVYHCAALMGDWGPYVAYEETNVTGVRNMLAAATRAKVKKFVYLSTSDIYGFPGRPANESEPPSPRGFAYPDSKIEAERLVWRHYRQVKLPVCIIRPATVYGPRSRTLVTEVIKALRRRTITLIDGGRHNAGLTYVGNLVDALMLAANSDASTGQAYNITDGSQVTWKQYIDALADAAELPRPARSQPHWLAYALATFWETYYSLQGRTEHPPMTRMAVELMGTDQSLPITKAQRDLHYRPRVTFEEGIEHTTRWLRQEGVIEMDAGEWAVEDTD